MIIPMMLPTRSASTVLETVSSSGLSNPNFDKLFDQFTCTCLLSAPPIWKEFLCLSLLCHYDCYMNRLKIKWLIYSPISPMIYEMIAMPDPIQLTIPRIRTPVLSSMQQQHFGKIVLAILKITVKGPTSFKNDTDNSFWLFRVTCNII